MFFTTYGSFFDLYSINQNNVGQDKSINRISVEERKKEMENGKELATGFCPSHMVLPLMSLCH